jgi:hypothetical protein
MQALATSSPDFGSANISYFQNLDSIEGWMELTAGFISALLMHYQNQTDIRGDICEIGVFKGKYFLTLATCLSNTEHAVAVDIFDDQSHSKDVTGYHELGVGSALSDVERDFRTNVEKYLDPSSYKILKASSTNIDTPILLEIGGPYRFFSVDGGHSRAVVLNDLKLADSSISDFGIISIDDFQNMQWPGVITAFFDYIPHANFVPFAIIPNKLLCCRPAMVTVYRDFLRKSAQTSLWRKDIELAESLVDLHANWMTAEQFTDAVRALSEPRI